MTLFKFGDLRFESTTLPAESMSRFSSYRWATQERVKRAPAKQWMGEGDSTIEFKGVLFPGLKVDGGTQGHKSIAEVERVGRKGEPGLLVDGTGTVYGMFVLDDVSEDREFFHVNAAPRRIAFNLKLSYYGEDEFGKDFESGVDGNTGGDTRNIA